MRLTRNKVKQQTRDTAKEKEKYKDPSYQGAFNIYVFIYIMLQVILFDDYPC
jgi:hypothetical protein